MALRAKNGIIRDAEVNDAPIILGLVRELADYAGLLDEVHATEQSLRATLSFEEACVGDPSPVTKATGENGQPPTKISPQRPARCLLLFAPEGTVAGFAVYYYTYSTWRSRPGVFLEDLFVKERERGRGFGKQLLTKVARRVMEVDGARLEWNVLKWNEKSIEFYKALGAVMMNEWSGMRIEGPALQSLAKAGR